MKLYSALEKSFVRVLRRVVVGGCYVGVCGGTWGFAVDYEQNGVDKNRGRVRLNRWDSRKMGELYGGREAETGRSLKSKRVQESRDRESAEVSFFFVLCLEW